MQPDPRSFAIAAHGDQQYGERPYVFHLDAVAGIAAAYGEDAVTLAYLHDVVEDTAVTVEEVERLFGARVAACVGLLTDQPGADRKERKQKTYARLAQVGSGATELALVVKAADRLANVRACVQDSNRRLWDVYRAEHEAFRAAAYRHGLCDPLWRELDSLLSDDAFKASLPTP